MSLTLQQRNGLRLALAREPYVRRALLVEGGDRPLLAFEYDERPETAEQAKERIEELIVGVAPALGSAAGSFGFTAGGPEDVAASAGHGELVYEREPRP